MHFDSIYNSKLIQYTESIQQNFKYVVVSSIRHLNIVEVYYVHNKGFTTTIDLSKPILDNLIKLKAMIMNKFARNSIRKSAIDMQYGLISAYNAVEPVFFEQDFWNISSQLPRHRIDSIRCVLFKKLQKKNLTDVYNILQKKFYTQPYLMTEINMSKYQLLFSNACKHDEASRPFYDNLRYI